MSYLSDGELAVPHIPAIQNAILPTEVIQRP
jgi:hypothetical protein